LGDRVRYSNKYIAVHRNREREIIFLLRERIYFAVHN
jgi:hypothetical protein